MRTLLPLFATVSILTACGRSVPVIVPPLPLPPPPAMALAPCVVPTLAGGDSVSIDQALRDRATVIKVCEAERAALVTGWPK